MKKWLIGLILVALLGVGLAGETLLDLGEPSTIAKPIEISLGQETKDKLANLSTTLVDVCVKEETVCLEYDKGVCEKIDEKTGECLVWKEPPKCIKEEIVCTEYGQETKPIGIISPNIISKGCTAKECCYDLIEEPYYHRYNTCLANTNSKESNEAKIIEYVKADLTKIANEENDKEKTDNTPDNIAITIK
jgi:hypothetical protein